MEKWEEKLSLYKSYVDDNGSAHVEFAFLFSYIYRRNNSDVAQMVCVILTKDIAPPHEKLVILTIYIILRR